MNRKKFLKRAAFSVAALPLIVQSCKDESTTPISSDGNTVCGDPITPAVPEGPYYVNEMLNRSAITEDRKGISLTLLVQANARRYNLDGNKIACGASRQEVIYPSREGQ